MFILSTGVELSVKAVAIAGFWLVMLAYKADCDASKVLLGNRVLGTWVVVVKVFAMTGRL